MRRAISLVLFGFVILFAVSALRPNIAAAGDGIPDNCEYSDAASYQPNVFPRYEPQNARLVLVDWATGAEVRELAANLPETRIVSWSPDCRYLAGAVYQADSIDTLVWDTTTGAPMGSVPDAHGQPHRITWGPGNLLIVETRDGAILWNVPGGRRVQLTSGSG